MKLRKVKFFYVCFYSIATFWKARKPSPDTDVISLIESVQDTMQTLFLHICGPDFRLHPLQKHFDKAQQEPTITQGGFCVRVMWELDGLKFSVVEARPHTTH